MQANSQLSIGLLNDIHYDGLAPAMNRLYEAVTALDRGGVDTLVVMGDLVNGTSEASSRRLLREVAALCEAFDGSIYYMPGNHDLDHLSKAEFFSALGCGGQETHFLFTRGACEFICLDANFSPDGAEYNRGGFDWREAVVPADQLDWLRDCLDAATVPVVVLSHQRLDPSKLHSVQNHTAVRSVLEASGKVKAVFQGHQHDEDLQQINGISYYTLAAHKDEAGPAVLNLDGRSLRLLRDFKGMEVA